MKHFPRKTLRINLTKLFAYNVCWNKSKEHKNTVVWFWSKQKKSCNIFSFDINFQLIFLCLFNKKKRERDREREGKKMQLNSLIFCVCVCRLRKKLNNFIAHKILSLQHFNHFSFQSETNETDALQKI